MKPPWWDAAEKEMDEIVYVFTEKLKKKLARPAKEIIHRKNPFLYRVRAASDVYEFAISVTDAYLSSSEETMFGNLLEGFSIAVCKHAKQGRKSGITNIDLEYDEGSTRTIIQVKSGETWGTSSQRKALYAAFDREAKVLRQGGELQVQCVEGICYGRSGRKDKGTHSLVIGRCFWEDISGWESTADGVMEVLGKHASNGLQSIRKELQNRMVVFLRDSGVVRSDNCIQWDQLLALAMDGKRS